MSTINKPIFPPTAPSPSWRFSSSLIMGATGAICRGFLFGLNNIETVGLDRFLQVLDRRKAVEGRDRGLITVSNHVSVIDDPLIWGLLPLSYGFNPVNHRWSLGSYDICFTNRFQSLFFTLGQVLPTHRKAHSDYGGLFQPTLTQAIRVLSSQPFSKAPESISPNLSQDPEVSDPFASGSLTYSTNGTDSFLAPSAYRSNTHGWVHIFPEGRIHQHPNKTLRYYKWGISRLILESEPIPEIIPIFVDGFQGVMHESRTFPRFVPRGGNDIRVAFGEAVDGEKIFGDLRRKWKCLVELQRESLVRKGIDPDETLQMGILTDGLKYGPEAVALREEVTKRVRDEVLKVRRSLGYPDEDPKQGLMETWIEEGSKEAGKMKDGSWVADT